MEMLGQTPPAPTKEQLIQSCSKAICRVMGSEMADEADIDRVWLLRKAHKNYLYYRDLEYFAPALYQGLVDSTGIDGSVVPYGDNGNGAYDYTQNNYRGYCRKFEAVVGTRIPNAVAIPNDPTDEMDIKAARAANNAAMYIRQHCEFQIQILWLAFSIFNFGTSFWSIEWVEDGDKYGYKSVPQMAEEDQPLGGGFNCPNCGATHGIDDPDNPQMPDECQQCGAAMKSAPYTPPFMAPVPKNLPPKQIPKGALEIEITDCTEISVPLDTDGMKGVAAAHWLRREREKHKSELLQKYGDILRNPQQSDNTFDDQTASLQYGESVRSAMASPIGVVRPKRENRWTVIEEDWQPRMYEMVDDKQIRQLLKENFPLGLRITAVRGVIVDLENRKLDEHWQECQPEPTKRIMADPLGDDWVVTQDILNNLLNQCNETVERANEPGFADPTRVDLDAYQRRRSEPGDLIPALRPAGGSLQDLIYRPPAVQFSEQIPPFRAQVEQTSQQNSGLLEVIWGGDTSDPTARQTELKTNAAIRQLSVMWVMMGKSLEKVYEKSCKLLADNEDGVLAFSKPKANEYGKFDSVAVVIEDLKGGSYHFEADEAIPMTWGQQRDLLMWMLDKPTEILKAWGLGDPMNIFEFKELLGMPGMRVPNLASRDKGMDIISQLVNAAPIPGPPQPNGMPGPKQPSIPPDWEDDSDFLSKLAKDYLTDNFELQQANPNGYANVQLWGQAHEKRAQQPPPKPPVKASVGVTLKGADLGDPAVQAALQDTGIVSQGVPVAAVPPPPKPGQMMAPPPGMPAMPPAPPASVQ